MEIRLDGYEGRVRAAVAHYWQTLERQRKKQKEKDEKKGSGATDHGRRAAVTGGKQMDGFCDLLRRFLELNGLSDASIYTDKRVTLPGFYRATKKWDLVVVHRKHFVAACEFKSQRGPSFGNNLNNRTEEALGNSVDIWAAVRENAFGENQLPPWLGWITLVEDCAGSRSIVKVDEPHFLVFPEFKNTSYAKRWEILHHKLLSEKNYNGAAFLLSSEDDGIKGDYSEPAQTLGMRVFLASLGGHIVTYLQTVK